MIKAPAEKVWTNLWSDAGYREWTSAFTGSSHAVSDWKEGSKILFLDDKGEGMVSRIVSRKPNQYMSFKHLGIVRPVGVEDTESEEVKAWGDAYENYTLQEDNTSTTLIVEFTVAGMPEDMLGYFMDTWPKALQKLKELAEKLTTA